MSVFSGSLAARLVRTPPREKGGAVAGSRLNFQHAWAVYCIARLHDLGAPYAVFVELHDDVAVVNDEAKPTSVDFFQVKAAHTELKVQDLGKPEAKSSKSGSGDHAPRSILGKLLHQWQLFGPDVGRLTIVSRPGFAKLKLRDGTSISDRDQVAIEELAPEVLSVLKTRMAEELGSNFNPPWEIVHLERCEFALKRCDVHCAGELAKVLKKCSPDIPIEHESFYLTLKARLLRQFANESREETFQELVRNCAYRRSDFDRAVSDARQVANRTRFNEIRSDLRAEGASLHAIEALEGGWIRYGVQLMNGSSAFHLLLRDQFSSVVAVVNARGVYQSLLEFVDQAEQEFLSRYGAPKTPTTLQDIRGGLLFERSRERDWKFQETHPESSSKEH